MAHEATTRRAILTAAASAAIAAPAVALAAAPATDETARFLAWERAAVFWYAASSNGKVETDEELDVMMDRQSAAETLIRETAGSSLTAARAKAAQASRIFDQFNIEVGEPDLAAIRDSDLLRSVVATLEGLIATAGEARPA